MALRRLLAGCPPLGRSLLEREQCLENRGRHLAGAAHERVDVTALDGLHETTPLRLTFHPSASTTRSAAPSHPGGFPAKATVPPMSSMSYRTPRRRTLTRIGRPGA